ncbi:MAG: hypothetical protein Q8K02_06210 [Flavobacterium sp.]|nr:hypothetical protein [Flavobacterium sp.]
MKIIITSIITLLCFKVNAQYTSIQNLDSPDNFPQSGVYYKDLNSVLDPFVGTWRYSSGNNEFEIVLEKKLESSQNGYYYRDMLIGSYRYVVNGIEKVNVLNTHDLSILNGDSNPIRAYVIITGNSRGCDECDSNEKWIIGAIKDPVSQTFNDLFIRNIIHNGQDAIKITIHYGGPRTRMDGELESTPVSFPAGAEYILIKQ